jgi:MFS family permease
MTVAVKEGKVSWRFLTPLLLGTMLNPLNSTMLATALVYLCNSFKVTTGQGAILITSLYITSTIAQPLMGRLADMFSAKKINALGFVLIFVASLIGIFAPTFGWLIVSRIFLGLGTSAAYPSAMALINSKYEQEGKKVPGAILGYIAMSAQLSMVLGPVLGGVLTQWLGWRGVFFINIPFVILAVVLARAIPDYPVNPANRKGSLVNRLDIPGILIFSLFLLSLLSILMAKSFQAWLIIPPVLLLALLIFWERKHQRPFIDVRLLAAKPSLSFIYLRTMAVTYVIYMVLYSLPQWIESVRHVAPGPTGLMMMPNSIMSMLLGIWVSRNKNVLLQNVVGAIVLALACGGLFFILNQNISLILVVCVSMVMGSAEGINIVANQALLNYEAPSAQKGVSFGLLRTFSYLGAIISSSQLKSAFRDGITDQKYHALSGSVFYSCIIVLLLLIPLWQNRKIYAEANR